MFRSGSIVVAVSAIVAAGAGCVAMDLESSQSGLEGEVDCGHHSADIVKQGGAVIGTAEVTDDGSSLLIDLSTGGELHLWQVHAYAGLDPVPVDASGKAWVEHFPFGVEFGGPDVHDAAAYPTAHTLAIPLADLGVDPGTCADLEIAVYVRVKRFVGGSFYGWFHSWVDGPTTIGVNYDYSQHGTAFGYTLCCEPPPEEPEPELGCTRTQGYWKNHTEFGSKKQQVDWPAPHDERDLLCGQPLLDILDTSPKGGDAWYILGHQFIAASLNVAAGASSPAEVASALAAAGDLLEATCGGMSAAERDDAIALAGLLDDYNNGVVGPGHCD